jgi:carbon-monoxide dehydrogenase large subunit
MTTTADKTESVLGQPVRRKEDGRLITGQTLWTDNVTLPGMLYMTVLRSPMAHARITRIDVEPARQRPGVVAVYSGTDLADSWSSLPMAWTVSEDLKTPPHMPLATDKVRYVGDGLAVVLATDPYAAADALEAIEVDYEPLPAVVGMPAALADGAPLVHDDIPNNRCFTFRLDYGDFEATRGRAEVVVKRQFYNQRLIPNAMEPRAVVVAPTSPTGQVTVWSATQVPHFVRIFLALNTGVPEHQIRVIAPDVGGGFGSKLDIYAEEVIAFVVARKLGKPVKWTESRSENYQATIHGRDVIQDVELTATRDGRVLGLKVDLTADMGGYLQLLTPSIPLLGRYMYPGIYKFDAHTLTCQGVFTNKTPTDAYRGAGRPEATFVIERIMDELAAELSMDPI